jgi:hypothetical protein
MQVVLLIVVPWFRQSFGGKEFSLLECLAEFQEVFFGGGDAATRPVRSDAGVGRYFVLVEPSSIFRACYRIFYQVQTLEYGTLS